MKALEKVKIDWNPCFAYAIGLITTDGNLSKDGRHIHFTSKDKELVESFKKSLNLSNSIGLKGRGGEVEKKYYVIQFGDVNFYRFLVSLGLKPAKSKTLGELVIPKEYFADFFRGCIDGDGSVNINNHPESKQLQLRLRLCSASLPFLEWVQGCVSENFGITGGWIQKISSKTTIYYLTYGKSDAIKIFGYIYYPNVNCFLLRKFVLAEKFMGEWWNGIHASFRN